MTSDTPMETMDPVEKFGTLQQKVISTYIEALRGALEPIEERYRQALGKLTANNQKYYEELGARLTAAYKSYGETVAAIPVGSPQLEQAVEAYNGFVSKYGEFVDPARWSEIIAPAQHRLNDAIAEAQSDGGEDAQRRMQEAVETFYRELNDLLQNDGSAKELSDAQSHYAEQLQQLQTDVAKSWQQAVESVNEGVKKAVAETDDAFDLTAASKSFAEELGAIGEEMTKAYRKAAETAAKFWQENWSDEDTAKATKMASGGSFTAAGWSSSPLATASLPNAPAASAAVNRAMAASPASMPRASWVNVPEPSGNGNKGGPKEKSADGSSSSSTSRGTGSGSGSKPSGGTEDKG